jgi:hypothetical protein
MLLSQLTKLLAVRPGADPRERNHPAKERLQTPLADGRPDLSPDGTPMKHVERRANYLLERVPSTKFRNGEQRLGLEGLEND